jgi:hypothetical protein
MQKFGFGLLLEGQSFIVTVETLAISETDVKMRLAAIQNNFYLNSARCTTMQIAYKVT